MAIVLLRPHRRPQLRAMPSAKNFEHLGHHLFLYKIFILNSFSAVPERFRLQMPRRRQQHVRLPTHLMGPARAGQDEKSRRQSLLPVRRLGEVCGMVRPPRRSLSAGQQGVPSILSLHGARSRPPQTAGPLFQMSGTPRLFWRRLRHTPENHPRPSTGLWFPARASFPGLIYEPAQHIHTPLDACRRRVSLNVVCNTRVDNEPIS